MCKYKKYPKYKESGVEWLGEIPEDWEVRRLGFYFSERREKVSDKDYPALSVTKNGIVSQLDNAAKTDDGDNRKKVCAGDFVINSRSDRKGSSGLSKLTGSVSLINTVLIPKTINSRYTHHLFRSYPFQEEFYRFGKGIVADLWSTNYAAMKNIIIPFPTTQEQQSIANYLDKAIVKIDTLIKKQERLIELLKEKRQAKVDLAIKDEQTQFKHLRYVVKQIFRPVKRIVDTEYEALGLYNRGRGLFHKPLKSEDELGDSNFYWVEEGDLILSGQFAWEGAVALAGSNENGCIVSHRYPIVRGKENIIDTKYLWAYLTTKEGDFLLNENSVGSAGRNRPLNMNTLMKEQIPVPSLKLQKEVAKIVKMEKEIKKSIATSITLLKERRNSLISAVVTGKIDVREVKR